MNLTTSEIAKMLDISCVQVNYDANNIKELVEVAKKYGCGQVSVLQSFIDESKELLKDNSDIKLVGNVSFPSGSDTTELKVIQAKQMAQAGCDEIDMVLNINWMKSELYDLVEKDIAAVVNVVSGRPLKVIIEVSALNDDEIRKASEICVSAGAAFVKTGTGWAGPTTVEHVKIIKSVVGDRIAIKASGGVNSLDLLLEMYQEGATRFGVNLEGGISILEESIARSNSQQVS